jgi:hypothetical protein
MRTSLRRVGESIGFANGDSRTHESAHHVYSPNDAEASGQGTMLPPEAKTQRGVGF